MRLLPTTGRIINLSVVRGLIKSRERKCGGLNVRVTFWTSGDALNILSREIICSELRFCEIHLTTTHKSNLQGERLQARGQEIIPTVQTLTAGVTTAAALAQGNY